MCDVFATPSLSEVNPVSVIEALASGKPYIGLTSDWWNEFSVEPLNELPPPGMLADDEHQLSQVIRRLSADKAERAGMSAQAKKLSRRFDIRDITAQWIEIYRAAIINGKETLHHHAK
jgi:glycosyltransferase involved in cell wall biosynthesis